MTTRKPEWLKIKAPNPESLLEMEKMLRNLSLHTVCEGAKCPNIGECFENKTATFMILGDVCTRNCRFCSVSKGTIKEVDEQEPKNVALAVKELGLKHVVITSVTRDDLEDGGAQQFANTIREIRKHNSNTTIEVLIPDLKGHKESLSIIVKEKPEILAHNIETVPSLYSKVRPTASYERSIDLLSSVWKLNPQIITKTSIMLGLGETEKEVISVMDDLIEVQCDIFTLGQYLRPTEDHLPIQEYITPEKFDAYRLIGLDKGFKYVASGPFVRSSYRAIEGIDHVMDKTLHLKR